MIDFEWESERPLTADLVGRIAAGFGIPFAVACILVALSHHKVAFGFLLLAVVAGIIAARSASSTKIKLQGNCLWYGSSMKADLQKLKDIRIKREFWVERVIVLEGTGELIPLSGIPKDSVDELIAALKERIRTVPGVESDSAR